MESCSGCLKVELTFNLLGSSLCRSPVISVVDFYANVYRMLTYYLKNSLMEFVRVTLCRAGEEHLMF